VHDVHKVVQLRHLHVTAVDVEQQVRVGDDERTPTVGRVREQHHLHP
jgi:hypothetical protein